MALIKSGLKIAGYYFVKVKSNIQKNNNNTINLIYDIDLGEKALIKDIQFIGNKIFKDRKLRNIIVSEENKFWKFLSNKKFLDEKRTRIDVNLLKNFYLNNGYYNVKIQNSFAQLYDDNQFGLVFNIEAGNKFTFNNSSLVLPADYEKNNFAKIKNLLTELKGKTYSNLLLNDILKEIDKIALSQQFEFINASINQEIVSNNQIDFTISITESEKFYVEKLTFLEIILLWKTLLEILLLLTKVML